MKIKVDTEFKELCKEILTYNRSLEEWADYESCDMFQSENYCGGFERIEEEFTFSYYVDDQEYWFQASLDEIKLIYSGTITEIEARVSD